MGLWDGILAPGMWVEVAGLSGLALQPPLSEASTVSLIFIFQLDFETQGHLGDYTWKIVKPLY